ncbi:hypothetical protein PGT21_008954 [Puccinia graminis f. sp. tritici]|uniref:Uncharacterized protein n=1 Tax=Puccinia graminis f. sp. tritici TaxID=56615 RepID=A0A5B0MMB4_PUCGR|nr:hypothetical protein PGT21_008954 [Puccinia graminis f. sp. tritici]
MSSRYEGSPYMGQSTAPINTSGAPPPLFHPPRAGSISPSSIPRNNQSLILHRGLLPGELYSEYGYSNQNVDFAAHGVPPSIPYFVYYNLPPPSEPHPSALTTSEISPSLPPPLNLLESTPSQTYSRPVLSSAPSRSADSHPSTHQSTYVASTPISDTSLRPSRPLPKSKAPRKVNNTKKNKKTPTQPVINPNPSAPVPDPTPPAGPLADLHDRQTKKRKFLTTTDSNQPEAQSEQELLKLSEAQLAIQARKTSKRAMSDDDREFFAEYQHYLRKLLIIRAIERGVSMPMVDSFLYRKANNNQATNSLEQLSEDQRGP